MEGSMSQRFDGWEGEHLAHYGILGMKWGVRRYQNPDGSLTALGLKRYAETGEYGYHYHSHATKKYNRKAQKQLLKVMKAKSLLKAKAEGKKLSDKDIEKADAKNQKAMQKAEKFSKRAERSAELDRREQAAAESVSTGKAIATRLLLSPASSKAYQQYRAMAGGGEHGAATKTMARVLSWYGGTAGSRIAKAAYIRKGEKDRGLANTINKAGSKTVENLRKEDEAMRGLGYIAKAGVMDSVNQARSMRTGQPYKSLIPKVATEEEERRAARRAQQQKKG